AEREMVWADGEREEWLRPSERTGTTRTIDTFHEAGGWPEVIRAYRDERITYAPHQVIMFAQAPEALVRPLLAGWEPRLPDYHLPNIKGLVARFELDVRHVVLANAKASPYGFGPALLPYLDVEVARLMADWFFRLKSARRIAREWLVGHGTYAVPYLVPDAVGKKGALRNKAIAALSLIASEHGEDAVVEAAKRFDA
ncbi:hypothetical protein ACFQ07_09195, partial [Actinomadura adrarensis]